MSRSHALVSHPRASAFDELLGALADGLTRIEMQALIEKSGRTRASPPSS
ncbi:MAG: hypothetical protein U1E70_14120 [Acetobacteraceae bacterium]